MPMDRSLYPENWEKIALYVKQEAQWHCVQCGRPCRKPHESVWNFINRLPAPWLADLQLSDEDDANRPKLGRFVLTVAHLDHDPANCSRANLKALCSGCHLRYDSRFHALKRRLKRERAGQVPLSFEG